jgi:DNA-binding response OmpR family regulator
MREQTVALEAFEKSTYDVLVLDVMMPILDGFELKK